MTADQQAAVGGQTIEIAVQPVILDIDVNVDINTEQAKHALEE